MFGGLDRIITSKAPEFPENATWLNTGEPLSLKKLKGNIVILDFWTYCCINCMHMLPVLGRIGDEYAKEPVVVIGVHSAKFENEQKPENIQEAIGRYEVRHPVIVDEKMKLWKAYGANAWPTIVIIDPKGSIVYKKPGEQPEVAIGSVVELLLEKYKGNVLADKRIEIKVPQHENKNVLSYPGKMSFSADGATFAISDSNHNRILVVQTSTGKVKTIIGSGKRGFSDGNLGSATFYRPQGVIWNGDDIIYVADTENHALREINLKEKAVKTLVGNGLQGKFVPFEFSGEGTKTSISSPWDLALYNGKVIITMAGTHQLWSYDIKSGYICPFAGSGLENIFDGQLPDAQFAQPSGIWIDGKYIYVADSEVSGVRSIDLNERYVSTLVGSGLFVFGHKDGPLNEARLQHPLGVCSSGSNIYVADTYNSSIRVIDLKKNEISTLVGTPTSKSFCKYGDPNCDTLGLYEPSDVKVNGNKLYIVDTNNHLVRIFDLKEMMLKTLQLKL